MSKSLARVRNVLEQSGAAFEIREVGQANTAQMAADQLGCSVDQIAKSIIFLGETTGRVHLFITAGGSQVCAEKAAALAGEPLGKADAATVRAQTGFAIGGVAPVGHISAIGAFLDPKLTEFATVWAAAGTPRHVFAISPRDLKEIFTPQVSDFTL